MFKIIKNLSLFMLFIAVLLWVISPALAQDTSATIVLPNGALPVETIWENIVRLIYNATFLPFAAGMVIVATALTKRIPFLKSVSSNVFSLWWTVLIWAIWIFATQVGFGGQFESLIAGLTTIGAAMLGIIITPIAAGKLYQSANAQGVAIIGYSRTPTMSGVAATMYKPTPIAETALHG